jgi:hypothetical protein
MANLSQQAQATLSLGTLSNLPSEIRQAIYKSALADTQIEFRETSRNDQQQDILSIKRCQGCAWSLKDISPLHTCTLRSPTPQPIALLHTSRIIRQEAISAICHYNTIKIKTKGSLSRFINTIIKGDTMIENEAKSNHYAMYPRYLKLDFALWFQHWLHDPLCGWGQNDGLKYLRLELDDWAQRLINLPARSRSTLIFKIELRKRRNNRTPEVQYDDKVYAEIRKFLRRVASRYRMFSKGNMRCVAEIRPVLDVKGRGDWRRDLGGFVEVV